MLLTGTDFLENDEKVQGVKRNIPKMFQIVPGTEFHLPEKFHEMRSRVFL